MSLVAATTLGLGQFDQVRAKISADRDLPGGASTDSERFRLIVQSYSKKSLEPDSRPGAYARPLGSVQRAITAEELRRGVEINVVQVGSEISGDDSVVVAWIEPGQPDLEFDAAQARPGNGVYYGVAQRRGEQIVLRPLS